MKNKYIDELNNIHADSFFKKQMIQKMEYESNKKIRFSRITTKLTLGFACACLLFISIFTYKTYQEMQFPTRKHSTSGIGRKIPGWCSYGQQCRRKLQFYQFWGISVKPV